MGAMVSRLIGKGPAAHQIWLPPLDEPATLDQILTPLGMIRNAVSVRLAGVATAS